MNPSPATVPPPRLSSEHLHDLVLLFFSVAYGTDSHLDPAEHHAIVNLVHRWVPDRERGEVEASVNAAFAAIRSGHGKSAEALALALQPALSQRLRRRVLADLGRVAKADGWLSVKEATVIARVRELWEG